MAKRVGKGSQRFKKAVGTTSSRLEYAQKKKVSVSLTSGATRIENRKRRSGTTETSGRARPKKRK
jgi:hypothetical protein